MIISGFFLSNCETNGLKFFPIFEKKFIAVSRRLGYSRFHPEHKQESRPK
jgi:hypothetical protein